MAGGKNEPLTHSAEYRFVVQGVHEQADIMLKESNAHFIYELMEGSQNIADKALVKQGAEGIDANAAGKYAEAESDFKSALAAKPLDARFDAQVRNNLSLTLVQEEKFAEAEKNCRQVLKDLEEDKSHAAGDEQLALNVLMISLVLQGKNGKELMNVVDRSVELNPKVAQENKADMERAHTIFTPLFMPPLP